MMRPPSGGLCSLHTGLKILFRHVGRQARRRLQRLTLLITDSANMLRLSTFCESGSVSIPTT